jgi:hypothetical protein
LVFFVAFFFAVFVVFVPFTGSFLYLVISGLLLVRFWVVLDSKPI